MVLDRFDRHEVFQFLRPDQMKKISDMAEVVTCESGEMVYEKDTPAAYFYIVLDGQVSLRLPSRSGISLEIDQLNEGAVFGSCVCFQLVNYSLNAQCTQGSRLLKIASATLKELMDDDLVMGYTIQTQISRIYFKRYIETMNKLQSIVMNLPLETTRSASEPTPALV
jgi:signal-transduction protein with cAMP-binding, CBS, and nucleotidyltransferase domain